MGLPTAQILPVLFERTEKNRQGTIVSPKFRVPDICHSDQNPRRIVANKVEVTVSQRFISIAL